MKTLTHNKFWYKQSHFEGNRTSYSWHPSTADMGAIVSETKTFYVLASGKKIKKENISLIEVNYFGETI